MSARFVSLDGILESSKIEWTERHMLSVLVRRWLENGGIFYRLDKLARVALGGNVREEPSGGE